MTSLYTTLACLVLTLGLVGCQEQAADHPEPTIDLAQVKADLETLAGARVYFAHQSVGRNLLKGIDMLMAETGVMLRIEEVKPGEAAPEGPGLFHANVGENGIADSKISAFVADVTAAAPYDVALLKFCYTDLGGDDAQDKSARELFDRYSKMVADVKQQQPNTMILHSTIPLRADPPGKKAKLQRLLGMSTSTDQGNILRFEYNSLLRTSEPQSLIFDVARLEATRFDGSLLTFRSNGREFEVLAPEHTYDGGHLDDPAKRYFAAKFLHMLAEAVRSRTSQVTQAL